MRIGLTPSQGARIAGALFALSAAALAPAVGAEDPGVLAGAPSATSSAAQAPPPRPIIVVPVTPLTLSDADILGKPPPYYRVESIALRYTHFDQTGTGYQSRAGRPGGPGIETLSVEQPVLEVVATQGDRITHRLWAPIDIVTAASPDAVDLVSTASRTNEAGTIDWTVGYKLSHATTIGVRNGFHGEENWRSWNSGISVVHSFAEDNAVVDVSVNQVSDWFDKYLLDGEHDGHTARSSTNLNVGLTQLLSPSTVAHVDYGVTVQRGQLSNGWNIVPLTTGRVALEVLPAERLRQSIMGRFAQWLPWNGALHGSYRFYVDDWGILAHTMEMELYQRLSSFSYIRFNYRFHRQSGADFFTTRALPTFSLATADSDLAALDAQTVGVKGAFNLPTRSLGNLRFDLSYEHYFRTNNLRVDIYSCGIATRF